MRCRFYGHNGMYGALIESHGNECALVRASYSPCVREQRGQAIDEETCQLVEIVADLFPRSDVTRPERALLLIESVVCLRCGCHAEGIPYPGVPLACGKTTPPD